MQSENLEGMVNSYNLNLQTILDKHALVKTKTVRTEQKQPWYNDMIQDQIKHRRLKECIWEKEQSEYAFWAFYNQRCYVSNIIKTAQRKYYIDVITANRYDTKAMFDIANKLLFHDDPLPLPPYEDAKLLANDFNTFFISKIDKIMEKLVPTVMHSIGPNYLESSYKMDKLLEVFTPIDIVYTKKLLQKNSSKVMWTWPDPNLIN